MTPIPPEPDDGLRPPIANDDVRFRHARDTASRYVRTILNGSASMYAELLDATAKFDNQQWDSLVLALSDSLDDPEEPVPLGAATVLLLLKRAERRAVDVYLRYLDHDEWDFRLRALTLLSMLENVPKPLRSHLSSWLTEEDPILRVAAAAVLRAESRAFPILRDALHDPNPGLVVIAASALGRSGKWVSQSVRALVELLEESESNEIRLGIVSVLSSMGQNARSAGPTLLRTLADPTTDGDVRKAVVLAIGSMGLGSEAREALTNVVRNGDADEIALAVLSLKGLGAIDEELITSLTTMLGSPSADDRLRAAWSLGNLGDAASSAIPDLLNAFLAEPDSVARRIIASTVVEIGPKPVERGEEAFGAVLGTLISRARSEEDLEELRVLVALIASFGPFALPTLLRMARSGRFQESRMGIVCLAHMGAEAAVAVAETLLTDADPHVREMGAAALAEIGPEAAVAVGSLIRIAKDADRSMLPDIMRALRAIGPAALEAADALVDLMMEDDELTASLAAGAIMAIGPVTVRTLRERFPDAHDAGKSRIAHLLGKFGEPVSDLEGLEVVREKAIEIVESLRTFQRIGELCKARDDDRFAFREMEMQLGMTDSTIQAHLREVSAFFRSYFEKFERIEGIAEDDRPAEQSRKIFDRGQRKKPSICRPLGWKAWNLADMFIRKLEERESLGRRRSRHRP